MAPIIFHIPHSGLKIPKKYWTICIKDKKYIHDTSIFLSDLLIDKLVPDRAHKIVCNYSRVFCDVERFKDDSKEIMAKKGMGVFYTRDCDNEISIPNKKYKRAILKSYYDKHHAKLDKRVTNILNKYRKCIIIDFHSYSNEMVKKLFNSSNNPDICIGTDPFYTDEFLINLTVNHFKKYGYSIAINKPYAGTIIPNKYFNKKEKRLSSIMIEINKRIYLTKEEDFNKLKECINEYYHILTSSI